MSLYPKWLLALSGTNLLSLLLSVLFLFGGVQPFGAAENEAERLLYYIGTQLFWLLPIASFFGALRVHDNEHPVWAALIAIGGIVVMMVGVLLLL